MAALLIIAPNWKLLIFVATGKQINDHILTQWNTTQQQKGINYYYVQQYS